MQKKNKHEQKFTTEVQKWMRSNSKALPISFAWEVKVATGDNLYFSQVTEHQRHSLITAKWRVFCYKISDYDQMKKPCDGVFIRNSAGFLIFYWARPKNKKFYLIDIDVFEDFETMVSKKSMKEKDAEEIAFLVGQLA